MKGFNVKEVRKGLGLTTSQFWSAVGIGEQAGRMFEEGAQIPPELIELVRLAHFEELDLAKVSFADVQIIDYFKRHELMDAYLNYRRTIQLTLRTSPT